MRLSFELDNMSSTLIRLAAATLEARLLLPLELFLLSVLKAGLAGKGTAVVPEATWRAAAMLLWWLFVLVAEWLRWREKGLEASLGGRGARAFPYFLRHAFS